MLESSSTARRPFPPKGLDRKIADGIWIEFRLGRCRVANADSLETKGLINLKLSPTPGTPKLLAGGS